LKILKDYAEHDGRIRITDRENQGSGPSRNQGIEISEGEYVSFMDADDYYPDADVLRILYEKATETDADICGGSMCFDREGVQSRGDNRFSSFDTEGWFGFSSFQWDYEFYRYLYRRSFLTENSLYFPQFRRYQDPPFLLDSMICAKRFYAVTSLTYCHRIEKEDYDRWSEEKVNDLAEGILYCLKTARENDLDTVISNSISRVNNDYRYVFVRSIREGNQKLLDILTQIDRYCEEQIDPLRIVKQGEAGIKKDVLSRELFSNIGKSIKENGILYTIRRILFHLHIGKDNDPERTVSKL
jgi:glycosyltransferase involved in cell wall biosynthesis